MRRLRFLISLLLTAALLIGAGLLLLRFDPFGWELSIISTTKTSARESVLREVRSVYRLDTVELLYKSVFPYDFLPAAPAEPDWRLLFYAEQTRTLSDEEQELLRFYRFCRELGIDLVSRDPGFAVVTVIARAGFDFEGFPLEENILIEGSQLTIGLPRPEITDLMIQDAPTARYPYPGMEISPENWKRLTDYVIAHLDPIIDETNILQRAGDRGEELFRRLVAARGFETIRFNYAE